VGVVGKEFHEQSFIKMELHCLKRKLHCKKTACMYSIVISLLQFKWYACPSGMSEVCTSARGGTVIVLSVSLALIHTDIRNSGIHPS